RTDLAKARESYSDEHPEVQRLMRVVRVLESRPQSEGNDLGSVEADNPAYIQIRAQREALDSTERALRAKQAKAQARHAEVVANTLKSTDVEKELSALYRR